jgi:hypothetical protein
MSVRTVMLSGDNKAYGSVGQLIESKVRLSFTVMRNRIPFANFVSGATYAVVSELRRSTQ